MVTANKICFSVQMGIQDIFAYSFLLNFYLPLLVRCWGDEDESLINVLWNKMIKMILLNSIL